MPGLLKLKELANKKSEIKPFSFKKMWKAECPDFKIIKSIKLVLAGIYINETSLKTSYFGLKPSKWLIFNSPPLRAG